MNSLLASLHTDSLGSYLRRDQLSLAYEAIDDRVVVVTGCGVLASLPNANAKHSAVTLRFEDSGDSA